MSASSNKNTTYLLSPIHPLPREVPIFEAQTRLSNTVDHTTQRSSLKPNNTPLYPAMADYRPPSADAHNPYNSTRERSGSMSVGAKGPATPAGDAQQASGESQAANGGAVQSDAARTSREDGPVGAAGATVGSAFKISPEMQENVNKVLASEHGVPTLLNRLKQSIASAKEFALFLQKRSILEEDHSRGLKKLCRMTQENMHRPEHREGTFAQAYDEMMVIHDRMADNAAQFAQSLHQMHDDLVELATVAERNRKGWKTNALAAEQKVADLEAAMRKSKTKYDSLAEEYDRVRTGEGKQGRVLGAFKQKSAAQQEEDLLKKVQMADQTYHGHVMALQGDKSALESSTRPEAVKALQDITKETDSGLLLQMQKFAAFNEKLLLSNGLIISPMKDGNGQTSTKSLRQVVLSIDNDKDVNEYIASHHGNIRPNQGEVKYERHPVLNPQNVQSQFNQGPPQQPMGSFNQNTYGQQQQQQPSSPQQQQQSFSMGSRTGTGTFGPQQGQGYQQQQSGLQAPGGPQDPSRPYSQPHQRSTSQGQMMQGPPQGSQGGPPQQFQQQAPPQQQFQQQPYQDNQYQQQQQYQQSHPQQQQAPSQQQQQQPQQFRQASPAGQYGSPSGGAPQLGALAFQSTSPTQPQQQSGQQPQQQYQQHQQPQQSLSPVQQGQMGAQQGHMMPPSPQTSNAAPTKPVYGVDLNHLYERDGLAVPMVVYQCMQAVDLFGLGVEGIYRQSGSLQHVQKLKAMFDHDSSNKALDFRNPENFYHDVNSVTGLLKQFFRDLPDPLLTHEHHDSFIQAAKENDDTMRRDSLHAIINNLPDPNYATLRAISLHLYRVIENSHINRMNSHNLAVIFGPTLMGSNPSTAIADAGWQIKVIDTILQNTYQIFDED